MFRWYSGLATDSLILGRDCYVKHCGSCHSLYFPEQFTVKEWEKRIPEMQIKAKCKKEEAALVLEYLKVREKKEGEEFWNRWDELVLPIYILFPSIAA
jgi:hypothetical protein